MVAKGSLGKYSPSKPSPAQYYSLVAVLIAFSLIMGRQAGLEPTGQWRLFSWHPFLMTCGMVGFAGLGAVTKKLGGYANTKTHGILGWLSLFASFGGIYCIYRNKENNGFHHLASPHAKVGLGVLISCVSLGLAGSIFLHPDFGMDKQNKTIRFAHKTASRLTLILAWITAFLGLFGIAAEKPLLLAAYGLPLVALVPFVLM